MSHTPKECAPDEHVWSAWMTTEVDEPGGPVFIITRRCYACPKIMSERAIAEEPPQ